MLSSSAPALDKNEDAQYENEEAEPLLPKSASATLPSEDSPDKAISMKERSRKKMSDAASSVSEAASSVLESVSLAPVFAESENKKLLFYDHDSLLTATSLLHIGKSVVGKRPVLHTLTYCTFLCGFSALGVFSIPRASKLDTAKFEAFGTFLKFFISFMLGIYVQQAFKRWWHTVTIFEKFLTGIRQMVFMLHTIRATSASRKQIEGYCVASGYILNVEVHNAQIGDKKKLIDMQEVYSWLVAQRLLSEEEVVQLGKGSETVLSKTRAIWCWIGELVSHPEAEEGKPVLLPLLSRTIMLCQTCVNEIEGLKMNIITQTPFLYAQLLAILVHVNNSLLAISCGMAIGSSMNEIRRRNEQLAGERETGHRDVTIMGQLYEAIQSATLQLVIALLTPMLYIAFLHIAHILNYPFGNESYHLPTETFIARLHSELDHMSDNRAYFRLKQERHKQTATKKVSKQGEKDEEADDDDADGGDDAGDE